MYRNAACTLTRCDVCLARFAFYLVLYASLAFLRTPPHTHIHTQITHRRRIVHSPPLFSNHSPIMDGIQLRDEAVRDRIRAAEEFLDPRKKEVDEALCARADLQQRTRERGVIRQTSC